MQPGMLVAGKYRIERIIGRGGMGLVVEATHVGLDARVALKFLAEEMVSEPTALARFQREARASAQLKSEHVCRVSDFGVEAKTPYIAMELLTGTDLARLSKVRLLDVPTAALYVKQACVGLAEAHAAGIVHRDLKPGNLFLSRRADGSPLVKVLDFGVAKAPEGEGDVKLTGTSNVVGSPGFMSPEQFRHSRNVDARTDIWSLGVILYKLVSGRLPFKADNFAEFALAISREPMPPLPEAPPEFEAIVARCLEKDPAKRFADVTELGFALTPFADRARPSSPTIADVPPHDPNEIASGIGSLSPGVAAAAPAGIGAPPPSGAQTKVHPHPAGDAKKPVQTMLGVATPTQAAPINMRPTAVETAVPGTLSGTGFDGSLARAGELAPGTQVGEYRIEGKIGEGGMGVVYAATHPLIGKKAAIKVISAELGTDPQIVQRFVQEARSVNQIGHPNIVDVFAFGQLRDGRNYFVMELLHGESLRGKLTRQFVSISEAVQILDEIANALEAAHEKGIVHRDLKPDNVFLAKVRNNYIIVKLLDFGIAKLAANEGGILKTSTGEMMGTPGYLSPEQARGKNVDYRTDIYALGCLMFEMVTGRLPFISESAMEMVMMHLSTPPPKPSALKPDIPVQLDQLIVQMMDKDPAKRPQLSYVRDVFAELVASGIVPIETGTGITFRSDLRRRRGESEVRTPSGLTPKPVPVAPAAAETLGRRRNPSPSDAPTAIAFTPGPDTLTPHATIVADKPRAKSRRGIAIAIVLVALLVPAVTIVIAMVNRDKQAEASDAAVTQAATPDAQVAVAVATDAATPDAASTTKHAIELRVNVPTAKIEIDGAPVAMVKGVAKVSLIEGDHHVLVSAAGREPYVTTLTVPSTSILDIKLERPKRTTTTTTQGEPEPNEPKGSAAKPPAGSGSSDPNYTVNPFPD